MTNSCQMGSKHRAARGQNEEAYLHCLLYSMCLFPLVNHSSWAVLLLNGHSKSACYSSRENGNAKLFNTPLNQLRQSQLVLCHIFYPPDLFSLSWPPFTSLWKEMQIFLSVMYRVNILQPVFFSPSVPADSFTVAVTVAASPAQTGLLWGFNLTFLSGHFAVSPIHWSLS